MVPEECPDAPQARDAKQHPREPPPGVYEQSRLLEGDTGAGATAAQQATLRGFHVCGKPVSGLEPPMRVQRAEDDARGCIGRTMAVRVKRIL